MDHFVYKRYKYVPYSEHDNIIVLFTFHYSLNSFVKRNFFLCFVPHTAFLGDGGVSHARRLLQLSNSIGI